MSNDEWIIKLPRLNFQKTASSISDRGNEVYIDFFINYDEAVGDMLGSVKVVRQQTLVFDDCHETDWNFQTDYGDGVTYKNNTTTALFTFLYNKKTGVLNPLCRQNELPTTTVIPVYFPSAGWKTIEIQKPDGVSDEEWVDALNGMLKLIQDACNDKN